MRNVTHRGLAAMGVLALVLSYGVRAADNADEVPFEEGKGPPAAKAGEGWCLVTKPAVYKTVTEQITVQPATHYATVIPAKYETKEETIQVAPETKVGSVVPASLKTEKVKVKVADEYESYEIVPAQWEWVEEDVVVKAASETLELIPASYKTVSEQVEIAPAKKFWKTGKDNNCYCYCETPAKFATITKQVLDKDASTRSIPIAAVSKKVKVHKLVKPAEVKKVVVPAEYIEVDRAVVDKAATVAYTSVPAKFETIRKEVQTAPEATQRVEVPAKTETISKQELVEPAKMVWRRMKCDCGPVQAKYEEVPGTDIESLLKYSSRK
ncbi:MAG: hypothetical protein M5U26_07665 [Planctomycetota bacterium]|nr:hypothetical protein [Planctomycetota bacterium]